MAVEPDSSLGRCLSQGARGKAELELRGPKVPGDALLKRYPEPHGQVTAYNRSPVH